MFPTGMAGIALLILRFSMAAVLVDVAARPPFTTSFWVLLAIALPAVALCLGLVTPYASAITCLIELVAALRSGHQYVFNLIISGVNTAVLGMLGPGSYSLDSRLFGRRIISFPVRGKSDGL